jgi:ABC-type branched-subunit amino acid transport system substrate-binding protein
MMTMRRIRFPGKVDFAVVLLAALALTVMAVACGGGEEKEGTATPGATSTAAATGAARPTAVASPGAIGPGVTDTEIILGQHTTMSGTTGAVYKMVTDAQHAYIRYVNAELGGVCGRQIVIKRYDDQGDYSKALEVTRKLVEEDQVLAIVGIIGPHDAAWEYLNEKGVPDLVAIVTSDKIAADPKGHPWTTVMPPSLYTEAGNFALYIKDAHPGEKVGLLYPNNESGKDQLRGLQEFLDPGNPLVDAESYEETAIDIRSQVLKLKESGAEVVVLSTSIPYTVQALTHADRMGWHPAFMATYGNADALLFKYAAPKLVEGLITFHAFKMPDWDDPAVAKHREIMEKYGGPEPSIFTILSQTMMEVVVETLNRTCDNLTYEGVMRANLSFDHWRTELLYPGCSMSTSETDRRFLQSGPAQKVVLVDGKPKWEAQPGIYEFKLPTEQ